MWNGRITGSNFRNTNGANECEGWRVRLGRSEWRFGEEEGEGKREWEFGVRGITRKGGDE